MTTDSEIGPGSRVRVAIPDAKWNEWSTDAAEALQGHAGVVERAKQESAGVGRGTVRKFLVRFDDPPPSSWHANHAPITSFWFDFDELDAQ